MKQEDAACGVLSARPPSIRTYWLSYMGSVSSYIITSQARYAARPPRGRILLRTIGFQNGIALQGGSVKGVCTGWNSWRGSQLFLNKYGTRRRGAGMAPLRNISRCQHELDNCLPLWLRVQMRRHTLDGLCAVVSSAGKRLREHGLGPPRRPHCCFWEQPRMTFG